MRTLQPPQATHHQVLALCLSATKDRDLHSRLSDITTDLITAGKSYEVNAVNASLHLIPRVQSVGNVTESELKSLYADHLSSSRGAARAVYDCIRNAAPNNRCPLCGVGTVAHCDHHLPKARYPDLSVLPANLVPACHFCNDKKRAKYPMNPEEQTFHPYFDGHLLRDNWIRATLDSGPPPALVFDTSPPQTWPAIDRNRVRRHFEACGLAITFTTNANDELPIIRDRLALLSSRGGTDAVKQFLEDERDLYSSRPNSWEYATYRTLAASLWFVGGGYMEIP